jgi:hypothetical protein
VDLEELLSMCDWGNIIVTSRDRTVLASVAGRVIDVPEIGKKSGVEVLLKGAGKSLEMLTGAGVFDLSFCNQFRIFAGADNHLKP